jgi:Tol biopolymer transport system component
MLVGNYPFNIWESKRKDGAWSSPVKLDPPVNTDFIEVHPSMAANGTLYFASTREGVSGKVGEGAIYSAELVNGEYPEVKRLKGEINSGDAGDPAVSADESFIVFGSFKSGGYGETDLYISFRLEDDNWSEPKNLGKNINSAAHEVGPFLSHDGKYLFFHRREKWKNPAYSDIYWVSTDLLYQLK